MWKHALDHAVLFNEEPTQPASRAINGDYTDRALSGTGWNPAPWLSVHMASPGQVDYVAIWVAPNFRYGDYREEAQPATYHGISLFDICLGSSAGDCTSTDAVKCNAEPIVN